MGTGTQDMIRRCTEAGLPEPAFAVSDGFRTIIRRAPAPGRAPQPESRPESQPESLETRVLLLLESGPKSKAELSRGARAERDLGSTQQGRPPAPGWGDDRVHHPWKTEQPAPEVPPHRARPGCARERLRRGYAMSIVGDQGTHRRRQHRTERPARDGRKACSWTAGRISAGYALCPVQGDEGVTVMWCDKEW